MNDNIWVALGIALFTIINSWGQFFVKEILLAKDQAEIDRTSKFLISKNFTFLIIVTGIVSAISVWFLYKEVLSPEPMTRLSCFFISGWCVLSILNIILIQSLLGIRRFAILKKEIEDVEKRANEQSIINALTFG